MTPQTMKPFKSEDIDLAYGTTRPQNTDIFEGLNPEQIEAVNAIDGPVVIRAGAGTGKTTVLIRRIANIVRLGRCRPEEILAVTFTKKAAGEMRSRLATMLGPDTARRITAGNFHAVSADILRRHAHVIGLPQRFTVLDDDGQKEVIGELAFRLGLLRSKKDKVTVARYLQQIASWKEDGHDKETILEARRIPGRLACLSIGPNEDDPEFLTRCAAVFEAYQCEIETRRWCDFADLVLHVVRIFREFPEILAEEAGRYRYIMVDEFQDTSPVQNQWVTCMAREHRNICVVGDTDQSIYQWRNARPEIMMGFARAWAGAREITIDRNYRSSQEILDAANAVVEELRRKDGLRKRLRSDRHGTPPADLVQRYDSGYDEANAIADLVARKIDAGTQPSEIAVLCRSGLIITGIERAMRQAQIRYVVAGAMKFTDREEIKDAMAWLALAANPMDYISFGRISGKPRRGIGPQKLSLLRQVMMEQAMTVRDAAASLAASARKGSADARNYGDLRDLLDRVAEIAANGSNTGAILEEILAETGYMAFRRDNEGDPQQDQRLENLDLLFDEATQYETPIEFLEVIALQSGSDRGWMDDAVVLSTVHASKGLEFDIVFCPAMEEGVFPNARSERTSYGKDEERRLAHVAWTRARKELHISHTGFRMGGQGTGQPSRYLSEANLLYGGATLRGSARGPAAAAGAPRRLRPRF